MTAPMIPLAVPTSVPSTDEGPYGKLIDDRDAEQQTRVAGSTFVASQRPDPERWVQVLRLADRYKVPAHFADTNYDALSKADERDRIGAQAGASPGLARWLSDPDNATIGKNELPALAKVDQHVRSLVPAPKNIAGEPSTYLGDVPWQANQVATLQSGVRQVEHAIKTGYSDMKAAVGSLAFAYGHATPEEAAQFVADANKNSANLRAIEPAYAKEAQAAMAPASRALDVNLAATKGEVSKDFQRGQILDALKRFASGNVQTVGDLLSIVRAAVTNPRGTAYSFAENAPAMVPILAGGAVGGAGGPVGAMAGTFIGMAPLNVGSEINSELQKRGYDITNSADLLRAYSDPALMADVRAKAARAGVTSAMVSSLVMGFVGKLTCV